MDFECIETWLALPAFRVTGQVMRPHNREWHLERRDTSLVCSRCQESCARIKEVAYSKTTSRCSKARD